ncbi:MAG: hypothetical protein KDB90_03180 [Planctomycetes bacterium]|nr:hypothetical protein [Planctomycetota bacterium]
MTAVRLLLVALLLAGAGCLHATVALKLDVATLTEKSDLIVVGKVDTSTAKWDAAKTGIWTHHDVTVSETLKGAHEKTRDVVTRGGVVGGVGQAVAGSGNLEIGTEYVFFLWKDYDGRYRLQGMAQGAFEISEREGVKYAENSLAGMTIVDAETLKPSRNKTDKLPLEFKLADLKKTVADLQKPAAGEDE